MIEGDPLAVATDLAIDAALFTGLRGAKPNVRSSISARLPPIQLESSPLRTTGPCPKT